MDAARILNRTADYLWKELCPTPPESKDHFWFHDGLAMIEKLLDEVSIAEKGVISTGDKINGKL